VTDYTKAVNLFYGMTPAKQEEIYSKVDPERKLHITNRLIACIDYVQKECVEHA
jgi:hypothetical protein